MKFRDKWLIVPDPNPIAHSDVMCFQCGQLFGGTGSTLQQSLAQAEAKLAMHSCVSTEKQP